jgi:hypothetical protein
MTSPEFDVIRDPLWDNIRLDRPAQLALDTPAMQRLRYVRAYKADQQLLNGHGTGQNLRGIIPQATAYSAPFDPAGTETNIDMIRLALLQAELAEYPSTGIVMHPSDWARIELPFVFGVAGEGAFPEAPNVFLGIRPGLKLFPVKWLYGKLATQLYFPGGEARRTVYLGASVGGGFEIRFAGVFALNAELNFNPFFTPEAVLPIEGRVGATFLF